MWHTTKWRKRTCARALQSKLGPVHQEGCGVPQNGTPRDTVHLHVNLPQPPRATVHPSSTSSNLHLQLFIHGLLFIEPPPTLLHRLLFNHPSPWAPVQPPIHWLLFIQPSTGSSCSSSPPWGPVHPAPTGSIDWGPVHAEAMPRGPAHPPPLLIVHPTPHRELFIQTPSTTLTIHPEAASIGFS